MGCGSSRLGEHGMVHPVKARPLLFLRFEESRKRRHLIESVSSKKDSSASPKKDAKDQSSVLTDDTGSCITSEGSKGGSPVKAKEEVKLDSEGGIIDTLAKDYYMHGTEEEVKDGGAKIDGHEEEDEGRMIGRRGADDVYSGSPSFRIYYTSELGDNKIEDVDDDEILTGIAPIEKDDPKPLKVEVEVEVPVPLCEEAKKGKKRRSFKNVLPTSRQAKNLFNVRAICMSRSQSNPDRAHLLTDRSSL